MFSPDISLRELTPLPLLGFFPKSRKKPRRGRGAKKDKKGFMLIKGKKACFAVLTSKKGLEPLTLSGLSFFSDFAFFLKEKPYQIFF